MFDVIGPYGRVRDVETMLLWQEVIKQPYTLLGEMVLGYVCNRTMTDISPSK